MSSFCLWETQMVADKQEGNNKTPAWFVLLLLLIDAS